MASCISGGAKVFLMQVMIIASIRNGTATELDGAINIWEMYSLKFSIVDYMHHTMKFALLPLYIILCLWYL